MRSFPERMTFCCPHVEAVQLKRYTITLGCGAVEVMNKFFEEIRLVMGDSKSVEVREIFLIPLGDMGFLQIKPDPLQVFLEYH